MAVYDSDRVHGSRVSLDELRAINARLSALPLEGRERVVGLDPKRAPVICAGLAILEEVMGAGGFGEFTVSESDILQGMVLEAARAAKPRGRDGGCNLPVESPARQKARPRAAPSPRAFCGRGGGAPRPPLANALGLRRFAPSAPAYGHAGGHARLTACDLPVRVPPQGEKARTGAAPSPEPFVVGAVGLEPTIRRGGF